jgi:hypothetical protein
MLSNVFDIGSGIFGYKVFMRKLCLIFSNRDPKEEEMQNLAWENFVEVSHFNVEGLLDIKGSLFIPHRAPVDLFMFKKNCCNIKLDMLLDVVLGHFVCETLLLEKILCVFEKNLVKKGEKMAGDKKFYKQPDCTFLLDVDVLQQEHEVCGQRV